MVQLLGAVRRYSREDFVRNGFHGLKRPLPNRIVIRIGIVGCRQFRLSEQAYRLDNCFIFRSESTVRHAGLQKLLELFW